MSAGPGDAVTRGDAGGLVVDRVLARALTSVGRIQREVHRARHLIADTKRRLANQPDADLVWQVLPRAIEALAATDPAVLADLLRRAGREAPQGAIALHAAAIDAVTLRDERLLPVALAYLRDEGAPSLRRRSTAVQESNALLATASLELPWLTSDTRHRLADLARRRPGTDGSGRIIPLIGPRGSGKTDATWWLARQWCRSGVVDHNAPWQVGVTSLLSYGGAYAVISQASRRVVLLEGGGFRGHGQYVQPSDLDQLVQEMKRPSAPVVILAARTDSQLRAFLQLHEDFPALTAPAVAFAAPDIEVLAVEAMRGQGPNADPAAYAEALRTLRRTPAWAGVESARRLRAAIRHAPADEPDLARALSMLMPSGTQDRLEDLLRELHDLVGLDEFKASVLAQLDALKEDQRRRAEGLRPLFALGHHVFVGPPGTGKTTVARLYARILHAAGALPRPDVIEVGRADLVGEYIGQTAPQVQRVVEQAVGGVLFIDEAYALNGHAENDFGREALAALVAEMENRRGDLVVILAGYEHETNEMIALNSGLRSRISRITHFPAMSSSEQVAVFRNLCRADGLEIARGVEGAVRRALARDGSGGNARSSRVLYESAVIRRASRVALVGGYTGLVPSDISADELGSNSEEPW